MPDHIPPLPPELPDAIALVFPDRGEPIREMLTLFAYGHLPTHLREISEPFALLAADMVNALDDGWQLFLGLHALVQAKDCMVRQRLLDHAAGLAGADWLAHGMGQSVD